MTVLSVKSVTQQDYERRVQRVMLYIRQNKILIRN